MRAQRPDSFRADPARTEVESNVTVASPHAPTPHAASACSAFVAACIAWRASPAAMAASRAGASGPVARS